MGSARSLYAAARAYADAKEMSDAACEAFVAHRSGIAMRAWNSARFATDRAREQLCEAALAACARTVSIQEGK